MSHLSLSHISLHLMVSLVPCLPVCPIFSLSSTFPFVWPFLVAPSLPPHRQPLNQSGRLALCWIHEEDPPGLGTLELQGWSPPAPGHVPPPGSAASSAASRSLTARPRADPQGPVPKSSLPSVTLWEWILASERSFQGDSWSSLSWSSEPEQIPWPCKISRIGSLEGLPTRGSISNLS